MSTVTYHVVACTAGRSYESFFFTSLESAAVAMGALDKLDAVDVEAIGYDADHIFCRADVRSGAVRVEFFATPIPVSATFLDIQARQDIAAVRYIAPFTTPEHEKLAAAGVTGTKADLAFHLAHAVADSTGRRPEDVLTVFVDVAARGALQSDDMEGIDGEGIDTLQALADFMGGTRSYAYRQVAEGAVSYETLMCALIDVTATP